MKTLTLLSLFLFPCFAADADLPLANTVVVLDPGHGGNDPGAHGRFRDIWVVESEHSYDTALRVRNLCQMLGGKVYLTAYDPKINTPIDNKPEEPLPQDFNHLFSFNKQPVRGGLEGILARMHYANQVLADSPKKRVVFISLHFDDNGSKDIAGANIIVPQTGPIPELAGFLAQSFREERVVRNNKGKEHFAIVRSGGDDKREKHLMILRGKEDAWNDEYNHVHQKVLVELGNFSSPTDMLRIRNPETRQLFAEAITDGILRINQLPQKQCQ